jgi:hypothetical protein
VLLTGDGDRADALEQPTGAGLPSAPTSACGSTSVPSGWAARPSRTQAPVCASRTTTFTDWVEESTPATSVTGEPCHNPSNSRLAEQVVGQLMTL